MLLLVEHNQPQPLKRGSFTMMQDDESASVGSQVDVTPDPKTSTSPISRKRPKKQVHFSGMVKCRFVEARCEYSHEEKSQMFYNAFELRMIRKDCLCTLKDFAQGKTLEPTEASLRGLENLIPQAANRRSRRKADSIALVLERQRCPVYSDLLMGEMYHQMADSSVRLAIRRGENDRVQVEKDLNEVPPLNRSMSR